MPRPVSSLFSHDEITLHKPENQKVIRTIKICIVAFALILAVGAIVAPFVGLGVTGSILLSIGATLFLLITFVARRRMHMDTKEANDDLLHAAYGSNEDQVKEALRFVGGEDKLGDGANVNVKDEVGDTPLKIAATECAKRFAKDKIHGYHKRLEVIAILLKNGADKNIVLFEDGTPPKGAERVAAEVKKLAKAEELQPLYKPTLADRFFKRWL